jgi:RNA polymerase sigma factor (sigma-70 family)
MTAHDREITATVLRERNRLSNFIRRRVRDPTDADDILQDVFFELIEAYHLPAPIERVNAWLFRVARNRVVDLFRKKREQYLEVIGGERTAEDGELRLDLLLPAPDGSPEAAYARSTLVTALQAALDELPTDQREVFVAHELDGLSFKEMASRSGVPMNTLLARKRYAVLHLRSSLQSTYDEFEM